VQHSHGAQHIRHGPIFFWAFRAQRLGGRGRDEAQNGHDGHHSNHTSVSRFCERTPANHTSVSRFCERTPSRCLLCCPLGQSARRRKTSLTRCPPSPRRLEDVKFRLWLAGLATLQFCLVFLNTFTNVRAARCAAVPLRVPAQNKM
jgi:hypothetical protein